MPWKQATCRHCKRCRRMKGRGLCSSCWAAVRDRYPLRLVHHPWTAKEVLWLRSSYSALGPRGCARALGRSVASVVMQAIAQGMIEFRRAAMLKVAQGITSTEEVLRELPSEYLGLEQ